MTRVKLETNAESVAAAVKLALDATEDAVIESVAVRPSGLQ